MESRHSGPASGRFNAPPASWARVCRAPKRRHYLEQFRPRRGPRRTACRAPWRVVKVWCERVVRFKPTSWPPSASTQNCSAVGYVCGGLPGVARTVRPPSNVCAAHWEQIPPCVGEMSPRERSSTSSVFRRGHMRWGNPAACPARDIEQAVVAHIRWRNVASTAWKRMRSCSKRTAGPWTASCNSS